MAARLLPLIFLCAGSPSARAESEFAVRLAPAAVFPAGESNFDGGFGLNAVLDWSFLSPADSGKLRMGIAAGGGMSSLSAAGSPFSITEGFAGPFVQWRALDRLSLRAFLSGGLYRYGYEQAAGSLSRFGGGASAAFHVSPAFSLFAEMAYTRYEFTKSNPIHVMSAGAGLRLSVSEFLSSPARVKVEETGRRPVFPVSFAWYEENPLMSVRVTNGEPNAVHDLRLRFLIERYMNEPSLFASLPELAPGETVELPVTALLTEAMLDLTENTAAAARLLLDYRSLGSARHADFPVRLGVHHRNAMNWDDDRRAASFVSPKDPAARLFARFTASVVEYALRPAGEIPLNAQYALALFETLNLYGMSYVIDPASSYAAMTEEAGSIDSLNYPCETLFYRGGDCDDLSILFCSMLEALDIPAAFITAPGHIYAAFDIGDGQEWPQGKQRGVIEAEGRLWLPVEITLPGAGFWEAVSAGARQWKSAGSRARLYPIREAWKVYPSVTVPEAGRRSPVLPEEARILRAFHSEAGKSGAPGKTGK